MLLLEPPSPLLLQGHRRRRARRRQQKLLDGFTGLDNPEHAANTLLYGIDNWYHLSQHTLEFRFDGHGVQTRATHPRTGSGASPRTPWDGSTRRPNSDPLLIDLAPKHYGARNPHQNQPGFLGRSIVGDKSVFPVHPTPGVNRGYQGDVLRDDKTLRTATAACGPAFYDAEALGAGFRGSAFVCERRGTSSSGMSSPTRTRSRGEEPVRQRRVPRLSG